MHIYFSLDIKVLKCLKFFASGKSVWKVLQFQMIINSLLMKIINEFILKLKEDLSIINFITENRRKKADSNQYTVKRPAS